MRRHRLRKRSSLLMLSSRPRNLLLFLTGLCCSFFSVFIITFYVRAPYIRSLLSGSNSAPVQPLLHELIENYQPRDFSGKKQSIKYDDHMIYDDFNYLEPASLTYKSRIYADNIEILFRFPEKIPLTAILLIFHSCRHSARDWFHTVERQRIIGSAIDLGYACLVFQALDKTNQCWSNDADIYENKDLQMVFRGLEGFYKEYPDLASLPRFTFGSSSGGIFSSIFAINQRHHIQGQVIFISLILPEILYTYVKTKNYPATTWIHMLRDIEFASEERINNSIRVFAEQKIPYKTFPIEPISLTHMTFHQRIPSISPETSRYIFFQLQRNQWLNSHNYLLYNPRRKLSWQGFLYPSSINNIKDKKIYKDLEKHKNIISDFINTVYGEHEISYERSFEALKWLKYIYASTRNQTNSNK